jgi:Protein of unknown function (DUF669)
VAKATRVDFGGVDPEIRKGGGRAAHLPEGDYLVKVLSGELRTSEKKGTKYFTWRLGVTQPEKYKGKVLYLTTSLKPEALWNLRNFIHAATGKNVAGKVVNVDPEALVGKVVCVTAEDDEYEGKMKSVPQDVRSKEEYTASEDDDDEEEVEETEEDDEEEEDLEEVDLDTI